MDCLDKKLILSSLFGVGFGCVVTAQMVHCVVHYWGSWRAWMFGVFGCINVITMVFLVRSHLRWFDAKIEYERSLARLELSQELFGGEQDG